MSFLADGDLPGARAVLSAAPKEVEPSALAAYMAQFYDLVWVLDDAQRQILFGLKPNAFDDDRSAWGLSLAQAYALRGDAVNVRRFAEEASSALEEQIRQGLKDPQRTALLGVALAYAGKNDEAVREGLKAVSALPISKDAYTGVYIQQQLVRIYVLVGEMDKAIDQLALLMDVPYFLTPGWLKVDPTFDPLRGNPRFQKLVAGSK
jgi:tetratricopeptide (TPR) repeat protein